MANSDKVPSDKIRNLINLLNKSIEYHNIGVIFEAHHFYKK